MKKKGFTIVTETHRSCLSCEYHESFMLRSGRPPLYRHKCKHQAWEDCTFGDRVIRDDSGNCETPGWCPFLAKVTSEKVQNQDR